MFLPGSRAFNLGGGGISLSISPLYPFFVFPNKIFPAGVGGFALGAAALEEVAEGGGEAVGGVELGEHVFGGDFEVALEHVGNLFFGGAAVAGDGGFDFEGGVFEDGEVAREGGGHGYALGAAQFEHALYVFAEKGGFDGEFVG